MPGVVPGAYDRPARLPAVAALPATCRTSCRAERPPLFGAEGAQARCFFPLVKQRSRCA